MSRAKTSSAGAWLGAFCSLGALLLCPVATAQTAADAPAPSAAPAGGSDADLLNDILSAPIAAPESASSPGAPGADAASAPAAASPSGGAVTPEAGGPIPVAESGSEASPAGPAQPERTAPHGRQIEEIVVTATKRAESVRDIPESITAFTGAGLEAQGKLSLFDFIQQSPGVTASQGAAGFTRITMRGISTDTSPYAGTPSPVGIFVGDTAFTDPYTANITPDLSAFDLAGVEILKGPQGTLFGGAALSGAVRYELQEPVTDQFQVRGFAQYSHPLFGGYETTSGGVVNLPVWKSEGLALRVTYVDRHYPGVYKDERTGAEAVDHAKGNQIRAIALWQPNDSFKFKFTHLTQRSDTPNALVLADHPHGPRGESENIIPNLSTNHFDLDNLELNYSLEDWFKVVSSSSRVRKVATFIGDDTGVLIGTPPAGYPESLAAGSTVIDNALDFSQELRIQSNGSGNFKWLAGLYYFAYHGYFNIYINFPATDPTAGPMSPLGTVATELGVPLTALTGSNLNLLDGDSNSRSKERAFFTNETLDLFDRRLQLEAGARLYTTEVFGGYIGTGILVIAEDNGMDTDTENSIKEKGINPKFSATFHFTPDISLYALAAKGFRFGGTSDIPSTATNGVPATFKSDSLWNYELGLRTAWLDDTLHADLTGFYLFYKNPIITQSTPGALPLSYSDNVSSAISRGAELNLLWNPPIDGLSLQAAGGLTDAHITAPFKASNGTEVEPGQEMPGASRVQGNTSVAYLRPVSFFLAGGNLNFTFIGHGYNDLTHDVKINGYGTLNAGLTFGSPVLPGHPTLALNVTNILDIARPNAGETGTAIVTQQKYALYTLNPPRTISLRFSFDF